MGTWLEGLAGGLGVGRGTGVVGEGVDLLEADPFGAPIWDRDAWRGVGVGGFEDEDDEEGWSDEEDDEEEEDDDKPYAGRPESL
jgi:hypothetical protein